MPVIPKSLLVLGASFLTTRTARRLKRVGRELPAQQAAFRTLLPALAATEQGRSFGLEPNLRYETFRARVPLRTYAQFAPQIERMKRGEEHVLWPGRCTLYATAAGTIGGPPRVVPVTAELAAHFRRAGLQAMLCYTARAGHCGVLRGRHLWLTGPSAVAPIAESLPFRAFAGDASGLAALHLPRWAAHHLFEPGLSVAAIADWSAKLAAIVQRTQRADITLVAGMPHLLLGLAEALLRATGPAPRDLQALWPNLECVVHGGVPLDPYHDELRAVAGRSVKFHEVYPSSEAFIAAQDAEPEAGLRLFADGGVFFEFLPVDELHAATGAPSGTKAVPLEQVRAGEDYALVLTTPGGFCRYLLGDVVRFTSTRPPRLVYVGRNELRLTAFAENVMEKQLTDALVTVCRRRGWTIVQFHVAPLLSSSLTGQKRGRHEWWIELRPGTIATPTGPLLGAELDRELIALSPDYAGRRRSAAMDTPLVRLVMPGFFDHWMRHQGRWGGQNKLPRCRSDRQIADGLAALACFTD
jgi:hypothetical protein